MQDISLPAFFYYHLFAASRTDFLNSFYILLPVKTQPCGQARLWATSQQIAAEEVKAKLQVSSN